MGEDELVNRLRAAVGGEVHADVPLAGRTTLRVGGTAAALVRAESIDDLRAVADTCRALERPWLVLGRGSNILVADEGWDGVVVTLGRGFRGVHTPEVDDPRSLPEGTSVEVVAGAAEPMPVLARTLARLGLGGLAFGVAIPGSLGGAVRMNAGAHGAELVDVLVWTELLRLGTTTAERWQASDLAMGYRKTALPSDAVVVRAALRLHRQDDAALEASMAEMRQWRREHQPISEPSCGSVFRNPAGDSAGRLVDASGLKGHRVGGARVSEVHANFITVEPEATASDVAAVIREVRHTVAATSGVTLEPEVVLAGFPDDVLDTGLEAGGG